MHCFCLAILLMQHLLLSFRLQLNHSQSTVVGLVEVMSGRRKLWAVGELAAIESGYRQLLEVKNSYPQVFLSFNVSSLGIQCVHKFT